MLGALQIKANTLEMIRKMHEPVAKGLQLRKSVRQTEREQKETVGECWSPRQTGASDFWLHSYHEVI